MATEDLRNIISKNRSILMGLAMIVIILHHQAFAFFIGPARPIFSGYGLWGVDVFQFVSGFGCVYALGKYSNLTFFKRRMLRLLPPCIIAGMVLLGIDSFLLLEKPDIPYWMRLFSLQRWYIQLIIISYLLCPVVFHILLRYKAKALVILVITCVVASLFTENINYFYFSWIFGRLPVFFVGMYIAMYNLRISRWMALLMVCAFITAILLRMPMKQNPIALWALCLTIAMPGICALTARARPILDKLRLTHVLEVIGGYSLEIYLTHEYVLWALTHYDIPQWSKDIIFLIVVCTLTLALSRASQFITKFWSPKP